MAFKYAIRSFWITFVVMLLMAMLLMTHIFFGFAVIATAAIVNIVLWSVLSAIFSGVTAWVKLYRFDKQRFSTRKESK